MDHEEVKSRVKRAVKAIKANWFPPLQPSLSEKQALSRKDVRTKAPLWVSQASFPVAHDESLRCAFLQAVTHLGDGTATFELESTDAVKVEWIGHQLSKAQTSSVVSEREKYESLLRDTRSEVTILYVHGGGYILGSPTASRGVAASLTKTTGGRVCSIDYRLAPQNPFPTAIYDILLAYLSLLSPNPCSFYQPIAATSVVLAGDSTGGAICLALLQVLLQFRRNSVAHLPLNNKLVAIPLPAGCAVMSAYCDHTDSLPSYLNTRNVDYSGQSPIYNDPNYPSCSIWPASPARAVAYCEGMALCHPLVSPAAAEDWTGSPPIWFACGEESVLDGCKVVARRAAEQSVHVSWEEYLGMPHIFPMLPGLGQRPQVKRCLREWAHFCQKCVVQPGEIGASRAVRVDIGGEVDNINVREMLEMDASEVKTRMGKGMTDIEQSFQRRQKHQTKL